MENNEKPEIKVGELLMGILGIVLLGIATYAIFF